MITAFLVSALAFFAFADNTAPATQPPSTASQPAHPPAIPRPKAAVMVDLNKQLPTRVDLTVGQHLVFLNGSHVRIQAKETDGKGQLLEMRPHNTLNQQMAYRAQRAGNGEVTVTYSHPGHHTVVGKLHTIKVRVTSTQSVATKAAAVAPVRIDVDGRLPQTVHLKKGQHVVLVRKLGLVGTSVSATVNATDGNPQQLAQRIMVAHRGPHGYSVVGEYRMDRAGRGEIRITHRVVAPGTRPTHKTIRVVVQ